MLMMRKRVKNARIITAKILTYFKTTLCLAMISNGTKITFSQTTNSFQSIVFNLQYEDLQSVNSSRMSPGI